MRSARAVRVNPLPRSSAPPPWLSSREPAGKALEMQPPKGLDQRRAAKLGEMRIGHLGKLRFDVGGKLVGEGAKEFVQHLMHDLPTRGRIGLGAKLFHIFELEDVSSENLVRVGDPALDARHAQAARPRVNRRAWSRRLGRIELRSFVALPRPGHPRLLWLDLL